MNNFIYKRKTVVVNAKKRLRLVKKQVKSDANPYRYNVATQPLP